MLDNQTLINKLDILYKYVKATEFGFKESNYN